MNLFGAFQQMGAANIAGQEILADLDEKKATARIANEKANAMATANADDARQKQNNAAMGEYLKSLQNLKDVDSTTAMDTAKQYSKTAEYAAGRGDFVGAKEMAALASGKLEEAKKADAEIERQDVRVQDDLSQAAQDVLMNPTPATHDRLFKAAIAARVPPDAIPLPGTTEYTTFANQSAMAALSGKARLEFLEKQREFNERQKAAKQAEDDRKQEQADKAKERALDREIRKDFHNQNLELRKTLAEQTAAARSTKGNGAGPGGSIGFRQDKAVVTFANEALRNIDNLVQFSGTQTTGVFSHLESPTTILKSLESSGTNKLTPEMEQIYSTAMAGLAQESANLAMAGTGRSAGQKTLAEFKRMSEVVKGDTELTAMYKMANNIEFIKARLEPVPNSSDPHIQATREKIDKRLAMFPTPTQVLEIAKRKGVNLDPAKKQVRTMQDRLNALKASDAAPYNPAPPDVEDALKQYK